MTPRPSTTGGARGVRGLTRFLPPLLWMGLIALASSSLLAGERTAQWMPGLLAHLVPWADPDTLAAAHFAVRKLGHLLEFGILAVLWRRALAPWPQAVTAAFVIAVAYAGVDEWRQGLTPDRVPAVTDVMVDTLGALIGLAAWEGPARLGARVSRATAWGLGLVAGVGLLLLLPLDLALGRPAGALGVCSLGLAVLSGALARLARRVAPPGESAGDSGIIGPPRRVGPAHSASGVQTRN